MKTSCVGELATSQHHYQFNKNQFQNFSDFLLKLQKLKITKIFEDTIHPEFSESFLKLLKNSTGLKSFEITVIEYSNCDYLGDFLVKQDKLEYLTADGSLGDFTLVEAICTENVIMNSKFKLKSLKVDIGKDYNEKFSRFLMKHSETIEELAINFYDMNFHYFRIILNHFHNIRKLSICIGSLLNDARVEEIRHIKLPRVKELKLVNHCNDGALFKILFDIFPNVEILTTQVFLPLLRVALEKLPKLRKLHSSSNYTVFQLLIFAKSESLTELILENVSSISAPIVMETLAEDLPNLEKFVIMNLDIGKLFITVQEDVKMILESLKLFKKMKSFELVNSESKRIFSNPDGEVGEGIEDEGQETATFRLVIETEDGQRTLEASNYFGEFQPEILEQLKKDLKIV